MTAPKLKLLTAAAVVLAALLPSSGFAAKPLKVYILAGQSNMDGQAAVRTIDFIGEDKDPARAALLKVFKPDGKDYVTRDDVWVANGGVYDKLQPGFGGRKNYDKLGSNIGPEYAFGYYMGAALDEKVLLIKYGYRNRDRNPLAAYCLGCCHEYAGIGEPARPAIPAILKACARQDS